MNYYNEIDSFAADWLENLIAAGHIAPGIVDRRDIRDVRPSDLDGHVQCHFFAGIGGWSYALRLAGWPDDRPVWTGSCPCQPFSAAGKGGGFADERHLWPAFFHLIGECKPAVVFGEQVASKDGLAWLDLVQADLEGADYAVGAADMCAAGVGAPHIRQRLWWVADTGYAERGSGDSARDDEGRNLLRQEREEGAAFLGQRGEDGGLADADGGNASAEGLQRSGEHGQQPQDGGAGELGYASLSGLQERERNRRIQREALGSHKGQAIVSGSDPWNSDWLPCRDGKARPVEPGTFPLAHGIPGRVGRLRAYGNAIVPQVAAEFIAAYLDVQNVER